MSNPKTKQDYMDEAKTVYKMLQEMNINENPERSGRQGYNSYYSSHYSSYASNDNSHNVWLLSRKWYDAWKQKTSFEMIDDGLELTEKNITDEELPRLNEDLLDPEEHHAEFENVEDEDFKFLNVVTRFPLMENVDFAYVSKSVWEYISKQYPDAIEVRRIAYKDFGDVKFDVNLYKVNFYMMPNDEAVKLMQEDPLNLLQVRRMQVTKRMKVSELKSTLIDIIKAKMPADTIPRFLYSSRVQILAFDSDSPWEETKQTILEEYEKMGQDEFEKEGIELECTNIKDDSDYLESYANNLTPGSSFLVLYKNAGDFLLKSNDDEDDTYGYGMMGYGYGPKKRKKKSKKFKGYPEKTAESVHGECGLRNLGNTCYMNSALQCLSHSKDLVNYFLAKKWKDEKNEDNPLGSKGLLVDAFAELMFQMWNSSYSVVSPSRFKYEMGSFQSMFDGMNQHDSQEFLSHLLDGLHEDLNMIQKKPYTEGVEGTPDEDDAVVARKSWVNFLRRNFSEIMKMFYGQFRSETRCPNCSKTVITFDPYQLISLAVPKRVTKFFSCYYITENQNSVATKLKFKITYVTSQVKRVFDLKTAMAEKYGGEADDYFLTFSGFSCYGYILGDDDCLQKAVMQEEDDNFTPRPFLFRMDEEQKAQFHNPKKLTVYGLTKLRKRRKIEHPGFTKYAFVEEGDTLKELYFRFFKLHAHFHDFDGQGMSINDAADSDEPLKEVDYRGLFEQYFLNGTEAQKFFKIVIGEDMVLQVTDEFTVGQAIEKAGEHWDANKRVLKVLLKVDLEGGRQVKLNLMKKCNSVYRPIEVKHQEEASSGVHLEMLLNKFSEPEQLDEQNTWYCSNCKDHVRAFKKIQIYNAPKYLIIHMKKLKQGGFSYSYSSEKPHNVEFPLKGLDMSKHVLNAQPPAAFNIQKDEFMDEGNTLLENKEIAAYQPQGNSGLIYDCYGVINHYGSSYFGHYTAYVKRGQHGWFCGDDSSFSEHRESGVVTDAAYVLFYKLREDGDDEDERFKNKEVKERKEESEESGYGGMDIESGADVGSYL
jgi:ubiquitin carboxyl-terminal hydrolase 4/11/15